MTNTSDDNDQDPELRAMDELGRIERQRHLTGRSGGARRLVVIALVIIVIAFAILWIVTR